MAPISDLSEILLEVSGQLSRLREVVVYHKRRISELLWKNHQLEQRNRELEEELSKYKKPKKDSHNSSVPPSQESIESKELRRTQSLRVPSGLKPGGQKGHKGHYLSLPDHIDREEIHSPDSCPGCGKRLTDLPEEMIEESYQIDLPDIRSEVIRHKIMARRCSCGCLVRGKAPSSVRGYLSYGPRLRATVGYLNSVHHLPYKRVVDVMKEMFGVSMSEGAVYNILHRLQSTCRKTYASIRDGLLEKPVVGADETGMHVNKRLQWFWTFQTNDLTYIFPHASRGKEAIDAHFPEGLPRSWLVTDRHASYFNMYVKGHQLCLAHLLRELNWLNELAPTQKWSEKMKTLLQEAIHKRKTLSWKMIDREKLMRRFNDLLAEKVDHLHEDIRRLQNSLIRHREDVLNFLFHDFLPYDNNASERSIRPLKVKQKVSGCFRTDKGAVAYAVLHSVTNTARKNDRSPWLELWKHASM